ncbi:MAG: helix-turn-helix transcriptional regulator [Defluviitaleaceae bacterium]|nr:helix-turn-helix transcriptional regulator [Defluviitaleaceae bacterium]
MKDNNILFVAEKLRLLRKAEGLTQYDIAATLLTRQARVSRIERGEDEYTENEIKTLKERFDVVDMPLTGFDCEAFKKRLYHWRDLIRSKRMAEAKELKEQICRIVKLDPCDDDLPVLYRIFEVLYLLMQGSLDIAKEKLEYLENIFDRMSVEQKYYYHCQKGILNALLNKHYDAIKFYREAQEIMKHHKDILPEDGEKLYYNLAVCYTELEIPSRAIVFLSRIPGIFTKKEMTPHSIGINIMLAINYYKVGEYIEAKEILQECLLNAEGINDKFYIGLSLYHLGVLHRYLEDWGKAVEYFDKALGVFNKDAHKYAGYHTLALYLKVRCIIGLRKFPEAESELRKAKLIKSEVDEYPIYLETLKHIMHLHKNNSNYNINAVKYLQNTSIPYFKKTNIRFEALDCYKFLARHEEKSGTQKKTIEIKNAICEMLAQRCTLCVLRTFCGECREAVKKTLS